MIARSVAHAGFTLERRLPHPVAQVWAAFAEESRKFEWFGTSEAWDAGEWAFDFRVGGVDIAEGTFHNGPVSRYVARYTDIVEHERIVTTYDMWIDGRHISTSVASYEFDGDGDATVLVHAEHGIHLDGFDDGALREQGSAEILDTLTAYLARG